MNAMKINKKAEVRRIEVVREYAYEQGNKRINSRQKSELVITQDPLESYLIDADGTIFNAVKYLGIRPKAKFPEQLERFLKDIDNPHKYKNLDNTAYLWSQKHGHTISHHPKVK